ncbi:hypothetical protein WJX72_011565 [[Myrmecia] bisecta]|uniref:UBX domain-containing protein n=1 Tax=[Myrmecia] bisecta TaxID=41462 RepID=A0AAW1R9G6_9CHLO
MASSSQTRSLWFEGSAAEATHISKTQRKLLVVLLAGTDVKGKAVQLLFQRPELEDVLRDQVVLKLEDDLTNTDPAAFSDAKAFRVFFPAAELPAVYCLGLKGALLSSSQGFQVNPIREALTKARAAFDEQVKAQTTQEALAALMALAQQHAAQHLGPHLSPMASLSFRLTNGSQLRADFPSDTPLHEVRTFLDLNRTDGGVPYILTTPYPRREFGPGDLDQSLLDLGLAPRSAIILQPTAGGAAGRLGSSGSTGGLVGGVTGAVGGIVGGVGSIVGGVWGGVKSLWGGGGSGGVSGGEAGSGPPQAQQALGGRSGGFGQLGQPGSGSGSAPGGPGASAAVRRRPFGSGHISGLHDGDDQQPDKAGNSYWNGNSTQYDGDDADKR